MTIFVAKRTGGVFGVMPSMMDSKAKPRASNQTKGKAPSEVAPKSARAKPGGPANSHTNGKSNGKSNEDANAVQSHNHATLGSTGRPTGKLQSPLKHPTTTKAAAKTARTNSPTKKSASRPASAPTKSEPRTVARAQQTKVVTAKALPQRRKIGQNGAGHVAVKPSESLDDLKNGAANGARHLARSSPTRAAEKKPDQKVQPAKNTAEKAKSATKVVNGLETNGVMQSNGKHRNGSSQVDQASIADLQSADTLKVTAITPKTRSTPRAGEANWSEITLQASYMPSESEAFMNAKQRLYFRTKLLKWKEDIVRQNMETLRGLHDESSQQADPADRATAETDRALELRARDRQRKLMGKIDAALGRIEEGSYGYCEETGDPISLKRLDARPIATLSLEAQERRERRERIFRDD